MITDTVRILADWLDDGAQGAMAFVPDVPRDDDVDAPDSITVFDDTRNDEVALRQVPSNLVGVGLLVSRYESPVDAVSPGNMPVPPDARIDVMIRAIYANKDTAAAQATLDVALRAAWKSLSRLMRIPEGYAARDRNSVQLINIERQGLLTFTNSEHDRFVGGVVLLTCRVRDKHAST